MGDELFGLTPADFLCYLYGMHQHASFSPSSPSIFRLPLRVKTSFDGTKLPMGVHWASDHNRQYELHRLTSRGRRVMCSEIRSGKPVRDRRCPATVSWAPLKKSRCSSSQATGRIDGAVSTFAGEGGFRTRIADPSALIRAAVRRSWPLPFLIAKFRPKRRWKTSSTERNFQMMRPRRARGVMSRRLQLRSWLMRRLSH